MFGLDGKTTPETFQRYAQWALFTPVARYFWRPPKIDSTRFPWSHGAKAEMNFRFYADLRYRLLPYYYALAREASQTGIPIMRPLVLEFDPFLQVQEKMADVYDQVMLGSGLMLAPVVQAKAEKRKVFLPPGTWYDFWSGETWLGPVEILYPGSPGTFAAVCAGRKYHSTGAFRDAVHPQQLAPLTGWNCMSSRPTRRNSPCMRTTAVPAPTRRANLPARVWRPGSCQETPPGWKFRFSRRKEPMPEFQPVVRWRWCATLPCRPRGWRWTENSLKNGPMTRNYAPSA